MIRIAFAPALDRLLTELTDAGVAHNGIGSSPVEGGEYEVFTYSETGEIIALPPEAQDVIETHVPPESEPDKPTRDDRLMDAVDSAKSAVTLSKAFTSEQAEVLSGIFDGLGRAIRGS